MPASAMRLLVIDDDEAILSLLKDLLSPDYQVVTAQDWLEGVDLLMNERFNLLIMDLGMPVFDSVEFINKVRSEPAHKRLPIIVISAYPDLRERLSESTVQAILAKPFSLEQLTRTIDHVLSSA